MRPLPPPIETARLLLRPFRLEDLPRVFLWAGDPVATQFTGGAKSLDETRRWLADMMHRTLREAPLGKRAIVLKADGLAIGYCGIGRLPHSAQREVEISYGLIRSCWGQGYATEAAGALLAHAFGELHLPEIVAAIHPENHASLAVARRLGLLPRRTMHWPGQGEVGVFAVDRPHLASAWSGRIAGE